MAAPLNHADFLYPSPTTRERPSGERRSDERALALGNPCSLAFCVTDITGAIGRSLRIVIEPQGRAGLPRKK